MKIFMFLSTKTLFQTLLGKQKRKEKKKSVVIFFISKSIYFICGLISNHFLSFTEVAISEKHLILKKAMGRSANTTLDIKNGPDGFYMIHITQNHRNELRPIAADQYKWRKFFAYRDSPQNIFLVGGCWIDVKYNNRILS